MIGSTHLAVPSTAMRPCLLALVVVFCSSVRAQPLVPWAVGQTRGGIPIVAVGAPGAPWGVVQLHVRLAVGDLTAAERLSLAPALEALADGALAGRARAISADVAEAGGTTRRRIGTDQAVIAEGAPMDRFEILLRSLDERLRARGRLLPAARRVDDEPTADLPLDPRALALALPGHPGALPASGGSADAAILRAVLDKLMRRDRVVLSVVGPLPATELLGLVLRIVGAPLPPGPAPSTVPVLLATGTRLAESALEGDAPGSSSTLWLVAPGRGGPGASPEARAARSVLARLVGGRTEGTDAVNAIALDVDSARPSGIARAEAARLQALLEVARTPPPADVVERLRTLERAQRLQALTDPAAIADALGRALLAGDAGLVDKEIAALGAVTPEAVAAAARAAAAGPRIVARTLGSAR